MISEYRHKPFLADSTLLSSLESDNSSINRDFYELVLLLEDFGYQGELKKRILEQLEKDLLQENNTLLGITEKLLDAMTSTAMTTEKVSEYFFRLIELNDLIRPLQDCVFKVLVTDVVTQLTESKAAKIKAGGKIYPMIIDFLTQSGIAVKDSGHMKVDDAHKSLFDITVCKSSPIEVATYLKRDATTLLAKEALVGENVTASEQQKFESFCNALSNHKVIVVEDLATRNLLRDYFARFGDEHNFVDSTTNTITIEVNFESIVELPIVMASQGFVDKPLSCKGNTPVSVIYIGAAYNAVSGVVSTVTNPLLPISVATIPRVTKLAEPVDKVSKPVRVELSFLEKKLHKMRTVFQSLPQQYQPRDTVALLGYFKDFALSDAMYFEGEFATSKGLVVQMLNQLFSYNTETIINFIVGQSQTITLPQLESVLRLCARPVMTKNTDADFAQKILSSPNKLSISNANQAYSFYPERIQPFLKAFRRSIELIEFLEVGHSHFYINLDTALHVTIVASDKSFLEFIIDCANPNNDARVFGSKMALDGSDRVPLNKRRERDLKTAFRNLLLNFIEKEQYPILTW